MCIHQTKTRSLRSTADNDECVCNQLSPSPSVVIQSQMEPDIAIQVHREEEVRVRAKSPSRSLQLQASYCERPNSPSRSLQSQAKGCKQMPLAEMVDHVTNWLTTKPVALGSNHMAAISTPEAKRKCREEVILWLEENQAPRQSCLRNERTLSPDAGCGIEDKLKLREHVVEWLSDVRDLSEKIRHGGEDHPVRETPESQECLQDAAVDDVVIAATQRPPESQECLEDAAVGEYASKQDHEEAPEPEPETAQVRLTEEVNGKSDTGALVEECIMQPTQQPTQPEATPEQKETPRLTESDQARGSARDSDGLTGSQRPTVTDSDQSEPKQIRKDIYFVTKKSTVSEDQRRSRDLTTTTTRPKEALVSHRGSTRSFEAPVSPQRQRRKLYAPTVLDHAAMTTVARRRPHALFRVVGVNYYMRCELPRAIEQANIDSLHRRMGVVEARTHCAVRIAYTPAMTSSGQMVHMLIEAEHFWQIGRCLAEMESSLPQLFHYAVFPEKLPCRNRDYPSATGFPVRSFGRRTINH